MSLKLAALPDPVDRAIKHVEEQAAQQQVPRLRLECPTPTGPIIIEFPVPLQPVNIVQIVVALADVVTGRAGQPQQQASADRIWTPPT